MPITNEQKLTKLFALMDEDSLTRAEFTKAVKAMVDHIKKIEKKNLTDLGAMSKGLTEASNKVKDTTSSEFNTLKEEVLSIVDKHLKTADSTVLSKLGDIDSKMLEVKNGRDADEDIIVDKVLGKIVIPEIKEIEKDLPTLGEPIRDALELLKGDSRLDVSAIKGIKKLLEGMSKPKDLGGSTNYQFQYFTDDETPVGLVNGTNKAFTISNIPNPAVSLKVYMNGQRQKLTEDYAFAGNTITFVNAPLTNSILTVDYRV